MLTTLANQVEGLSSDALLDCLISGLKRELHVELIPWQPEDLTKAVSLAKLFEERHPRSARTPTAKWTYSPDINFKALPTPQPLNSTTNTALPAPEPTTTKFPQPPQAAKRKNWLH